MLPEIKLVMKVVGACGAAGAILGAIIGAMTSDFLTLNYLIWVGVAAIFGSSAGLALAYGLLPES